MSEENPGSHPKERVLSTDVEGFDDLKALALDLLSTSHHAVSKVWRQLDPVLWDLTHSPWIVLQTVSREKLQREMSDPVFRKTVDDLVQARRDAVDAPAWFQETYPQSALNCVAYFSMEFMLSEALPIYSGGLGNVAGDQLKAASDLGVPVVGVGLLYQHGYFRQVIDKDGAQQPLFPYNEPGQLPVTPLRKPDGEWLRFEIVLPEYSVWLRAWQVQVGRVKLYLLDSNDAANDPAHRGITSYLYGGGPELRLLQEILLGIGGWRLLSALGIKPQVCHLNEGHSAFVILERARCCMEETGLPFEDALAVTRAGNLFTTHTAVVAGFDRFDPALVAQYLGPYAEQKLGIKPRDLLALGRRHPNDALEPFNMAYLAIHGSGAVNGVSALHGDVSRHLFQSMFPGWPMEEVPIGHVTNGVHMPTWSSPVADFLWAGRSGKDRWEVANDAEDQGIRSASDAELWQFRSAARGNLVEYVRKKMVHQTAVSGAPPEAIEAAKHLFDDNTLTLGFARRFATYKRSDLLLHDPERLVRLLTNAQRPVQLIIAGKAHPADHPGQALIQQWMRFIGRPDVRHHVIFLSDYDMRVAKQLVRGVDVWLNTPRRPWEACGTSGMKVLVNGGINLSELDGWWAEAYSPQVGWALGDGQEHGDDPAWDISEADALYDLLEREVVPEFYARDQQGIPTAWTARMRESMAQLMPRFSASRAVREYTESYYLPAASTCRSRAAGQGKGGADMVAWRHAMDRQWSALHFGDVRYESDGDKHVFDVQVYLGDLAPEAVAVELYANAVNGHASDRARMERLHPLVGASNGYAYRAQMTSARPASDYTARIVAARDGVAVPLEDSHIYWQR